MIVSRKNALADCLKSMGFVWASLSDQHHKSSRATIWPTFRDRFGQLRPNNGTQSVRVADPGILTQPLKRPKLYIEHHNRPAPTQRIPGKTRQERPEASSASCRPPCQLHEPLKTRDVSPGLAAWMLHRPKSEPALGCCREHRRRRHEYRVAPASVLASHESPDAAGTNHH